ncbi:hypothetical protein GGH92_002382 [Coemansia sp. RSA 2673]|nr:hypothetical protein GGH92_002382 [Coemansia sp. RSA 2673]
MDKLLRGIQPHTIDLCIFDLIPSFANVPYYFYYGNDANDSDFMPAEQLRESFYMALLEFPIIVGHLETDMAVGTPRSWLTRTTSTFPSSSSRKAVCTFATSALPSLAGTPCLAGWLPLAR